MSDKILDVRNVSKQYDKRTALRNVSFEVYAGEIFGFIGPNGAGKTTLIRIICGLTRPSKGEVFICGNSVQHDFENAMYYMGALLENSQCYPYMTGWQNLQYYAKLYKHVLPSRIRDIVEVVGLSARIHDRVKTYSYGMRQRLGLAQALLHNPKLLILDEPTNGLDVNGVIELRKTLKVLAAKTGIAILISSHALAEVEQLCDVIAIVDRGSVIELRTMDELKESHDMQKRARVRVDYPNYAAKVLTLKFDTRVELAGNSVLVPFDNELLPQMLKALEQRNITIYGTTIVTKSLEDIYIDIINENKRRNYVGL